MTAPKAIPAFPCPDLTASEGMSLRDWFAGQAIPDATHLMFAQDHETFAQRAYAMADAMMAERAIAAEIRASIRTEGTKP